MIIMKCIPQIKSVSDSTSFIFTMYHHGDVLDEVLFPLCSPQGDREGLVVHMIDDVASGTVTYGTPSNLFSTEHQVVH